MLIQLDDLPLDLVLEEQRESSVLAGDSSNSSCAGVRRRARWGLGVCVGVDVTVRVGRGLARHDPGDSCVRSSITESSSLAAASCASCVSCGEVLQLTERLT